MNIIFRNRLRALITTALILPVLIMSSAHAQEVQPATEQSAQVVEYDAIFFSRYRPNTALDMVMQLPGFELDDGADNRGFAAAVGNILINNRRLSAKQDLPSATLARIPASQVEKIQLVRGQTGGIDLQGQSVVANIFLRHEETRAVRWMAYVEQNNTAAIKPAGSISLADTWRGIDYNTGIDIERNTSGYYGNEQEFDSDGALVSAGPESSRETGYQLNAISLNASSLLGKTFVHLNTRFNSVDSLYKRPSYTVDYISNTRTDVFITTDRVTNQYELGMDAERNLSRELNGKIIFLLSNRKQDAVSTRRNSNSVDGQTLFRVADTEVLENERIARLEFDWGGWEQHQLQFNLEGAYNILESDLVQTEDRGAGPSVVDVPGANSRVEELRGDFLLQDTWTHGHVELDLGMGMEISSVSQSGDADQKRNFFFLKPQTSISYSPTQDVQTRMRIMREVSQLNLPDFVTATVFEDNDLALGNPDIRPDTTWVTELSHERRYGRIGVFKLTGFHHWISNVLDLLPITDDFEAPGNIGNGRRWGVEFEGTLPLQWLGLTGARLETKLKWQDSTVVDPVTGENRILSGESGQNAYRTLTNRNKNNHYFASISFRQDLEASRLAWGWTVAERAERPLYRVNELDVYYENVAMDAFIETTRWFGVKIRIDAQNINDDAQERERTVFIGRRNLTPVEYRLLNDRYNGRRLVLTLSGSF